MTNCDVINIRNIITSECTIYWIREIKRSPDTMKAAAILVSIPVHGNYQLSHTYVDSQHKSCILNAHDRVFFLKKKHSRG